jgi:hypothetical protein
MEHGKQALAPAMMSPSKAPLAVFDQFVPAPNWEWRDRHGIMWDPRRMETHHLFYTIRMIWNNSMPLHMRVGNVIVYTFPDMYTIQYMRDAVLHLGKELLRREDKLAYWQKDELRQMAEHLNAQNYQSTPKDAHHLPPAQKRLGGK